jgi:hypothetical protein
MMEGMMVFQGILILVMLALGIGIGIFASRKLKFLNKKASTNISSTVKKILPVSEYACLVYQYTSVVKHSDPQKFFNLLANPFTGKKAIYSIDGTIKLGFNGKEIRIECTKYNNIIVRMPEIKILTHQVHPDTFQAYDETTGLFAKYTLKEGYDLAKTNQEEKEKDVIADDELFMQARISAEHQFRALMENFPDIKGKYTLVFEWPVKPETA